VGPIMGWQAGGRPIWAGVTLAPHAKALKEGRGPWRGTGAVLGGALGVSVPCRRGMKVNIVGWRKAAVGLDCGTEGWEKGCSAFREIEKILMR
jgi:hypothetical protein